MPGESVTEWIDLADFTPGIHSGTRSFQTGLPESASDGVAQIRDTWGCVANPNGGLEAAPALVYEHELELEYAVGEGGENRVPGHPTGSRILAFGVTQATYYEQYTENASGDIDNPPDLVALLNQVQFIDDLDRLFFSAVARVFPLNDLSNYDGAYMNTAPTSSSVIGQWGLGNIVFVRSAMDADGNYDLAFPPVPNIWFQFSHRYGASWDTKTTSFPGLPGSGVPAGYSTGGGGGGTDPGPEVQWTQYAGYGNGGVFRAAYHQGRLVMTSATSAALTSGEPVRDTYVALSEGQDLYSDEKLDYYDVFDPGNSSVAGSQVVVDSGRPDQIGAMLSYNTNELWIVKARGGGVVVRDSMERPSVNRFPGVESTGAYPHEPVLVPGLGLVYGGVGGVFAWNGGNQSQQLSASIDGTFWLTPENVDRAWTDDVDLPRPRLPQTGCGKFSYQFPFIYAPNNWIMDIRTGGWFRLCPTRELASDAGLADPGHDLAYFDVSSSGQVYAAPDIQKKDDLVAWVRFNPKRGTDRFSWRSQPLARPLRGRKLIFRECNIVTSGYGTVDVTLIGIDGETETRSLTVAQDRPHLTILKFNMSAYDIELKLVSEADDGGAVPAAPLDTITVAQSEWTATSGDLGVWSADTSSNVVGAMSNEVAVIVVDSYPAGDPEPPAFTPVPADSDPGWTVTAFITDAVLPNDFGTLTDDSPTGTIDLVIVRYSIRESDETLLGYLYHQVNDQGEGSDYAQWWAFRPAGGALTDWVDVSLGDETFAITMTEAIAGHPIVAPTIHRLSLGYQESNSSNRQVAVV